MEWSPQSDKKDHNSPSGTALEWALSEALDRGEKLPPDERDDHAQVEVLALTISANANVPVTFWILMWYTLPFSAPFTKMV